MKIRKFHIAVLLTSSLLVCQKNVEDPMVSVGKNLLGQKSFEAFEKVADIYPATPLSHFPGKRKRVTYMVECEAIHQECMSKSLKNEITGSLDWEWKKKYYTSSLFFDLFENLGFTEKQLKEYYNTNKELFRKDIKTEDDKDSSFIPSFDVAKRQVANQLFGEKTKPDSQFIAGIGEKAKDSTALKNHWVNYVRKNPPDNYFLPHLYKEKFGKPLSDSTDQFFGEGKIITAQDLEVINSWLSDRPNRQHMNKKELLRWLLKWELFSEQAVKMNLTERPLYDQMMDWALKIEYAKEYLSQKVIPQLPRKGSNDTALAKLSYFDRIGRVAELDSSEMESQLKRIEDFRINVNLDSILHTIRESAGIEFSHSDYNDNRSTDYKALMAQADSLKEASSDPDLEPQKASELLDKAEKNYRTLTDNFAFTAEGEKAFGEAAKILIDKYNSKPNAQKFMLYSAIEFYRRGLFLDSDGENSCNSLFMIGFTFDEHLNNYELAEENYKLILKDNPDCKLASDAEFMMLHLNEPMTSIEEIQSQTMRQGKKVAE